MVPRPTALALAGLVLGQLGCVESGAYDKAAAQLEGARIAVAQKDVQLRAFQWQLDTLAQQLREGQQRSDALQREREAQLQQLATVNGTLTERVKRLELERADLLQAESLRATEPTGSGRGGLRPDEVRRLLAVNAARDAQIVEELARIERALAAVTGTPSAPRRSAGSSSDVASRPGAAVDVVDPWGFGSRK